MPLLTQSPDLSETSLPNSGPVRNADARRRRWVLLVAFAALAIKLVLAFHTFGSLDVLTWRNDVQKWRRSGTEVLYKEGITYQVRDVRVEQPFIHPPLVIHLLRLWSWAETKTSLPLQFWMRASCAVADLTAVLLLLRLCGPSLALVLLAASPVSLQVSGYHGNTDPLMIGMVLLTVYCLQTRRPVWMGAAAFALAVSIKLAAVIFAPAILLALPTRRSQARFLATMAGVMALGSVPYIFTNPALIVRSVLGYNSYPSTWGITRLLYTLLGETDPVTRAYNSCGKFLFAAAIVASCLWLKRTGKPLLFQCAVSSLLFLLLTPGFGVQYLVWALPWTVLLPLPAALLYHLSAGAFLFGFYNRSAGGLPWYYSDSLHVPPLYGWVMFSGLLCWLIVGCVLLQIADNEIRSAKKAKPVSGSHY